MTTISVNGSWADDTFRLMGHNATNTINRVYVLPDARDNLQMCLIRLTVGHGTGVLSQGFAQPWQNQASRATVELAIDAGSLQDRLARIESQLGFTVSDLAKILDVERKTLYLWKAGATKTPQQRIADRLSDIESIGRAWAVLTSQPLVWAKQAMPQGLQGQTLFEAMTAPVLDVTAVQQVLPELAQGIVARAKTQRRIDNAAIKAATSTVALPSSQDMAQKLRARAEQFQSGNTNPPPVN